MFKLTVFLLILNFQTSAFSSTKEKIISQIELINILSFNFTQTVGEKSEKGFCIIKYPKKIWCEYHNSNKKIIISNGKSLVIKTANKGSYYLYPLSKTPLVFLLDKKYLISRMNDLEPREIDGKYLNFKFFEGNNEINIFFDKKNLSLIGWQTEDIYQNLAITFISSVKINQKISDKIFILPNNIY